MFPGEVLKPFVCFDIALAGNPAPRNIFGNLDKYNLDPLFLELFDEPYERVPFTGIFLIILRICPAAIMSFPGDIAFVVGIGKYSGTVDYPFVMGIYRQGRRLFFSGLCDGSFGFESSPAMSNQEPTISEYAVAIVDYHHAVHEFRKKIFEE